MAQPFKDFLIELANDAELRQAFEDDPISVGEGAGLTLDQIKAIARSNAEEIQAQLIDEAKAAGEGAKPGTAKPMVTIDN